MCTDFLIAVPKDNIAVVGRSMEFANTLNSTVKYHKANTTIESVENKKKWTVKYSYLSINANVGDHITFPTDGMNSAGFSIGSLWFAGFAAFQDKPTDDNSINLAIVVDYLLSNYSTVQDVLDDINSGKLSVWARPLEQNLCPLHFPIHDKSGACGILEFTKDKTTAIINPSSVCTNAPGIEWHLHNLGYYASLTCQSTKITVGSGDNAMEVPLSGMGSGLRGIPGDYFPASRFVRTYYGLQFCMEHQPPKDSQEAVLLAGHLLNTVDIAKGQNRDFVTVLHPKPGYDFTQWVVIKDLNAGKLYYRTYNSQAFVTVDLNTITWEDGENRPLIDAPAISM